MKLRTGMNAAALVIVVLMVGSFGCAKKSNTAATLAPGASETPSASPGASASASPSASAASTPGAAAFGVSGATAGVSPASYSGGCPKTFTFTGHITAVGVGDVTYKWERSDGAIAPSHTLHFSGSGTRTVTDTWTLSPASFSGWERVHVLSPTDLSSGKANFTLTCVVSVTGATASVSPTNGTGTCPTTFTFTGHITTNGPTTVHYKWERSDGATAPSQTLTFTHAGTQTVQETWQLGAHPYSGWERVSVLSPNALVSNKANFTNSCY